MSPLINPNTKDMIDMTPIKAGVYLAKCVKTEAGVSKEGNSKIVLHWEVSVDGNVRPRQGHHVISGKGSGTFDQLLRAVGAQDPRFIELADKYKAGERVPFDTDALVGTSVNIIIGEQMYDHQLRDTINGYLPA